MPQSIPQETKVCTKCSTEYPATTEFFSFRKDYGKLRSHCRNCVRKRWREWDHKHIDKRRERNRQKYAENVDQEHERSRLKYIRHKEKIREYGKKRRQAYPDKLRQLKKNWRAANPDKARELDRVQSGRYRTRKNELPATLTIDEWETILAEYGYQCAYCPKTWLDCKLTQDHIVPIVQGGGYTADNIVPACPSCNSRKGGRTPEQAEMVLRDINQHNA